MSCYRQVISKMKVTEPDTVLAGARLALPLAVADLVDGIAFGAIAAGLGAGWLEATTMSATAYSGSAQYATLTIVRDGGSLAWVLAAVVGLNARYLVFGASVAPALSENRLLRAAQAQLVTDAAWALALRGGRVRRGLLIGAGIESLLAWTGGTALGAAAGAIVGDYRVIGLDAALPAFFLCLLLERFTRVRGAGAAIAGAGLAVALTPFVPPGLPLVAVLVASLASSRG